MQAMYTKQSISSPMTKEKKLQTGNKNGAVVPNEVAHLSPAQKKYSQEEIRLLLRKYVGAECDPYQILKKLGETVLPKFFSTDPKLHKEGSDAFTKMMPAAAMIIGLENHHPLAGTVGERYRPFVIELADQFVKEYDCKTTTEKALAEVAAGSYCRFLEYSEHFNACIRLDYLSPVKTGYYGMLSKAVDRAERHFLSAIIALKQSKNPPIELNVRTAFVGQNQQFNSVGGQKENDAPK